MSDNRLANVLSQLKEIKAQTADTVDVEVSKKLDECILEIEKAIAVKPSKTNLFKVITMIYRAIKIIEYFTGG